MKKLHLHKILDRLVSAGILVWAMSYISDRYSSKIIPIVLRRIALTPFIILLTLLILSGLLVMRPLPHVILSFIIHSSFISPWWLGDITAFILLLGAVLEVVFAGYVMDKRINDIKIIISWLQKEAIQQIALQDVILNAIQRTEQGITLEALHAAFKNSFARKSFLSWLIEHQDILTPMWVTREVINVLLANPLDKFSAEEVDEILVLLFQKALDAEEIELATFILKKTFAALQGVEWSHQHGWIVYRYCSAVFYSGDTVDNIPRIMKSTETLDRIQVEFAQRTYAVFNSLIERKDKESINLFAEDIAGFLDVIQANETVRWRFFHMIDDMAELGYKEKLLTMDTLITLTYGLGSINRSTLLSENEQEYVMGMIIELGGVAVLVNGDEKVISKMFLRANLIDYKRANAGGVWVDPKSYDKARKILEEVYQKRESAKSKI